MTAEAAAVGLVGMQHLMQAYEGGDDDAWDDDSFIQLSEEGSDDGSYCTSRCGSEFRSTGIQGISAEPINISVCSVVSMICKTNNIVLRVY
jgi:hypothetical protein